METMDTSFPLIDQNFDVQESSTEWNDFMPNQYQTQVIREDPAMVNNQVTYWDQVCFMMHLFGDVKEPLRSSVTLVNNLLESQMDILIGKCENAMKLRGAEEISHKDVLFLMRRNKALLKCLLHFLDFVGSQVHECLAFLSSIEKFPGDLTCLYSKKIFDHMAKKRFKRRLSIDLIDDPGFKSFEDEFLPKLRQMRPLHRLDHPDEFMEWLCKCRFKYPAGEYPFDISLLAASIIDFLAIQTVAGLVEKALHMRSRAREREEMRPVLIFKNTDHIRLFEDTEDDESENNFSDNEDLSSLSAFPKVALCPTNSSYSSCDFIQHMGNPPVIIPVREESEILAEKPITPDEIQIAFLHYQRPKPMSVLMKSKPPYSQKREVNLICLAFSADEYDEL